MAAANSTPPVLTPLLIARFWSRVSVGLPDQCWPWQKRWAWSKHSFGKRCPYGTFWVTPRKGFGSHIIARFIATGEWPVGRETMHQCDNPLCCNPSHLVLGTHADNMHDMIAKGRNRTDPLRGDSHSRAKLTEARVIELRNLYLTGEHTFAQLGRRYGVSTVAARLAAIGKTWRHIA